jgi:hypothetical protein
MHIEFREKKAIGGSELRISGRTGCGKAHRAKLSARWVS